MGAVYQAIDEQIDRQVAIKILRPEYAHLPEVASRFLTEARAANLIKHPNIVQVHEFGTLPDGVTYMVMEHLDGVTLTQRLRDRGPALKEAEAVYITWQVALALEAAHARDIVHRDLKPSNIMLVPDPTIPSGERIKVLDFGIAKVLGNDRRQEGPRTRTGAVIGTPLYMSPEQCRGDKELDGQADVYSLGVLLFHLLAGTPPFEADGDGALIGMHIYEAPPALAERVPFISAPIAALVGRTLQKNKQQRPTMREFANALMEQVENRSGAFRSEVSVRPAPSSIGPSKQSQAEASSGAASSAAEPLSDLVPSPQNPTTIGFSSGQLGWSASTRRRTLLAGAVVAAFGALFLGWLWLRPPAAPKVMSAAPVARRVTITLTSKPEGAQVLRLPGAEPLGTTPWRREEFAQAGQIALRLRLAAHQDQDVVAPLDQDLTRLVTMVPTPSIPRTAATAKPSPGCSNGYVLNRKTGKCMRRKPAVGRTKLMVD